MKTTKYLYDITPEELDGHTYWSGLDFKLKKATELFRELYVANKDGDRMFYVNKAMEHTRELIEERKNV